MVSLHYYVLGLASFSLALAFRITREAPENDSLGTLRQVNVVLRHGNRAPQSTYPNDPHKNDPMEPFGWGQLTNEGRLNQYNQGLFLRERYGDFLGEKYSPDIFWLQSTSPDRAKMSALLEAAALWQPNKNQTFKDGLSWQPVALNYQPGEEDTLLLIWSTCPDYARMRELAYKSTELKSINDDNKDLYAALEKNSGMKVTGPDDVFDIYGTLEAESSMKLPLPDWTNEYFPDAMEPMSKLSLKLNVYNEDMLKMKIAPLITQITTSMKDKSEGKLKPKDRKMFMYVGHDSTVASLLEGMKVWDMQIPGYSIMTMIELHEDTNGWNVQLYLRNSTMHEPYPLMVPGCDFECPLNKFMEILKPMIMTREEWKQLCVLKDPNYVPGEVPLP